MPAIVPHKIDWETNPPTVTVRSSFTGIEHTQQIPMTREGYDLFMSGRAFIQHALPDATSDQREFLLTGATTEEWDDAFKDDADEQEYSEYEEDVE